MALEMDVLAILVIALGALILMVWFATRFGRTRQGTRAEPSYELEELVSCKSCGSLIPEGGPANAHFAEPGN